MNPKSSLFVPEERRANARYQAQGIKVAKYNGGILFTCGPLA
jgi:hypothetical protein